MQYLIFLLFFCCEFSSVARATESNIQTQKNLIGYRVIRTSPSEFRNALWMNESNSRGANENSSRLSKYLKIINKSVRQNFVSFQVRPDMTLLKESYFQNQLTEFVIEEKKIADQHFKFNIIVNTPGKNSVRGHIDAVRHELGSLLTFYLDQSTYNETTMQFIIKSFQLIKIIANDQESAAKNTLKDSK